jgi:urease accessory protein
MPGVHLPLMVWLSPAFPVGGFAYSHGLEWAHEAGDLQDVDGLEGWLGDLLRFGAARNDAVIFAAAYRAAASSDAAKLAEIAELALALATSAERRLETTTQGDAFIAAISRSWPCAAVELLRASWSGPVAYPVAVAAAAAGHGIPLEEAVEAFSLAFVSNLVSAAVRLGVVGQTDGQRVIASLLSAIRELAGFALDSTLDDLGGCAFRSDLAALRHETQYTRLFRS